MLGGLDRRADSFLGRGDFLLTTVLAGEDLFVGKLGFVPFRDDAEVFHRLGALEDPGQCVVVGSRDWVELVVVASRTAKGQAQKCLADGVQLFIDDVHLHFAGIILGEHLGAEHQEAGGDDSP